MTPGPAALLVVGLAATGEAVVGRLRREGLDVTVIEDRPGGADYERRRAAALALGARVVEGPDPAQASAMASSSSIVVPSPGVPARHPAIRAALAAGVPVRSEIDLAAERASAPIVAVTGTNGKTTVTTLVVAMLQASGLRAVPAGNIGLTLIEALDRDAEVLVVEVSSFQLEFTEVFRPRVAVLLAVAEDHLDWHGDVEHYVAAKARVFAHQRDDDLLVFDADDAVARRLAAGAPARTVGVSLDPAASDCYHLHGPEEALVAPGRAERGIEFGDPGERGGFGRAGDLGRALPHDLVDALAAAAAAREMGATPDGIREALHGFAGLPHRVTLVGDAGGVRYYDDSKATNPHAALHAVRCFDSVVLLAGGRNKGLDLGVLAEAADHVSVVVAFGEAGPEVAAAFEGRRPVVQVDSLRAGVRAAVDQARPGDVVLLAPGCASFDEYPGYAARGDAFAAQVRALLTADVGRG